MKLLKIVENILKLLKKADNNWKELKTSGKLPQINWKYLKTP